MRRDRGDTSRVAVAFRAGTERLVLLAIDGPAVGLEFTLNRPSAILGRGRGASLNLPDSAVSRLHVKLTLVPDASRAGRPNVLLQDLESTNGVKVNGIAVKRRVLKGGEKILVGKTVLRLERRDAYDAAFYGRLQKLATTDPLTGVGNRLSLAQEMERQESEWIRYGRPYGLLLVDLDHFKRVNDRWGHAAGDQVLRGVATTIASSLRGPDRAFRYGGEEFIVTLSETDRQGLLAVAERIRAAVAATPVKFKDHSFRLTVSIGGAAGGTEDPITLADRALYQAKRRGRNRSVLNGATPQRPKNR
jgi:diguanylate cyclase (GGDEF)-like protein